MNSKIQDIISASISVKQQVLADEQLLQVIDAATQACITALRNGNKLLFCGNGGSAADAQHLAAEFTGRFYSDRKALPAEALHCNTSYLTAVANDYSYDVVYSRMVEGIAKEGDILIGLSTSGNSKNIVKAFEQAFLAVMENKHADVLAAIRKGAWGDTEIATIEAAAKDVLPGYTA